MVYDGHTRTCGVFGNPVAHTLSPLIHNYLAELTGNNMVYVPFHVENELLEDAVKGAYALDIQGCNVTVPHKSAVIPYLAEIDPLAEQIGAVNTLVRTKGGFKGYNTDMPGLYKAMLRDGVDPEGYSCIILGAGGVARAIAMMLADKEVSEIYLLNRTYEKAHEIAEEVNNVMQKQVVFPMRMQDYTKLPSDRRYLAVQATSVGMHPNEGHAVIEDEAFYQLVEVGYDTVYKPAETRFMQLVKAAGGKACNGAGMLVCQGIISYELWYDVSISDEIVDKVYDKMAEAMKV